ncbi:MAG TPA: cellulose binding domain-containing protein, partial [Ktedonobacteraceae bacterium]|nr:cellulose binding domain-containing protein [Ktedonobacteraceae bacterium]
TRDGSQAQQLWCDYAQAGCVNITGSFVNLTSPTSTADTYAQISFSSSAGSIATNSNSGEMQLRFNKSDWSNYNQANDYSWNPNQTSYASWSQVTLYLNGQLVWGTEPGGGSAPTVTPTSQISPTPTVQTTPPGTPTTTPGATPTPGNTCTGAIFCDNFESQTGSTPSGAWQVSFPNCQGTGTASVDRTQAHSGSTSIRVDGRAGYCNHVFFGSTSILSAAGTDIFVRLFIRHSTALPTGHVTFAAMMDTNDTNHDLRFGGQNSALQWNRSSDDATLPAQSPAGVALSTPLPVNQWSCVQFEINEAQGTMRTWLNGNEVAGLHLDQVATQDVDAQWLSRPSWRPSLADLRFGWESYSDGDDTLWFDDIAIASQQLSCAA